MLTYTGHPLLDVGAATITAFSGKDRPEELTDADLEAAADYMLNLYTDPVITGLLSVAFTINGGFTQFGYAKMPEKKAVYGRKMLFSFRQGTPEQSETDPLLDLPVLGIPLDPDDKLPLGRAYRQHIPFLLGEDVINFYAEGQAGLPVSGLSLLATHAAVLGSVKCGGRMLFVHSDNPDILHHFAATFLKENQRAIHLAHMDTKAKMSEPPLKFRTLLIHTLMEARAMQWQAQQAERPFSVTAYHLSNSGQGPALDIYYLPSQMVLYLKEMRRPSVSDKWQRLVWGAWEKPKLKKGQLEAPPDYQPPRNWVYEDLFTLAGDLITAPRFIRTHFLRRADLSSWPMTEPFLRRILKMEQQRIQAIATLGDILAEYIYTENDKRFYQEFYGARFPDDLRRTLLRANNKLFRRGQPPMLTLNGFLDVFEEGEEVARADWRLARDLVVIRIIEQLYAKGKADVIRDVNVDAEDNNNTSNDTSSIS